jgi:hypothetical protein
MPPAISGSNTVVRWLCWERAALVLVLNGAALFLAGCETTRGRSASPPPPAPYNLSGYSAGFKEGYADACAKPARRNAERLKVDADYSMGWNDGESACRGR